MATFGPPLVVTSGLADDAVTNVKMADDAIKAAEIEAGAVGTSEIADTTIVNADISASAAIVDTKLATISTAGKVDGAAITGLASLPAGAGVIPTANVPASVQSFSVPLVTNAGARTGEGTSDYLYANLPDAGTNSVYASFFMPTAGTISSIQWFVAPSSAGGGNFIISYNFRSTPGGAMETDSAAGVTVASGGTADQPEVVTIAATTYDGLTRGRVWHVEIIRLGADAGDTSTNGARALTLLVNLS